ncbi:HAD-IA family hydrolase [Streptomyces sp. NPDC007991]|uniref:HAD-IA family hydrolase n=1 Tax=Streptomyces sp. NPDC007991 TaxID=3364803 RepID=UPI0036E4769D
MTGIRDIEVVVLDVLGTLVDEPRGPRAAMAEALPASGEAAVDDLLVLWQQHSEEEQRRIRQGLRAYVSTETLDAEAARRGRTALPRLNAHAGLRRHQALSAEAVQAYKPAPEVYRLALDAAGCPPERVLMVAAHAWDLCGAQTVGMRTAHVRRPVGDPPASDDAFDGRFDELSRPVSWLTGDQIASG